MVKLPLAIQKTLHWTRKKRTTITAVAFLISAILSYQPTPQLAPSGQGKPVNSVLGIQSQLILPTPAAKPYLTAPTPTLLAESAVVLDRASHTLLLAKNPHERLPPASTTKIATAIITLANDDLEKVLNVPPEITTQTNGSNMGLKPFMQLTTKDLLWGLLLNSGNDAAYTLAKANPDGIGGFVKQMNQLAHRLHLNNTHFVNPSGLDNPNHYSSSYDLALLMNYALQNKLFSQMVGTSQKTITTQGGETLQLQNTNHLLGKVPGVIGGKTGYTPKAKGVMVISAKLNGHQIIAVVMGSPQRENDAAEIINWAFQNVRW